MPPEYYQWIENLQARDTMVMGFAAIAVVLFYLARFIRFPRLPLPLRAPYIPPSYLLAAIILLGLGLRLFHLGSQSLWYDEALSALTAQRTIPDILTISKYSSHPPLYYLLLWAWSKIWGVGSGLVSLASRLDVGATGQPLLGHWPGLKIQALVHLYRASPPPEWWLRLPSALMGVVNIGLLYRVARQLRRPQAEALIAAALMSFSPFQLFYSQEARMYELLLLCALVVLLGYLNGRWWLVSLAGAVMMHTQTMGALFLVSLGIAATLLDRKQLKPLILSGATVGLLYAPWGAWGLFSQMNLVQGGWIPQVTPGGFLYLWHVLLWGEISPLPVIFPGMVVSFLLAAAAVHAGVTEKLHKLLILMVGPPTLAVVASLTIAHVFLPRPLITATPAFYILIAAALRRQRRWMLAALLAALLALALHGYYFNPNLQKWPHRAWAAEIERRYQPGDAVFYVSHFLPFWYYLPNLPTYFLAQDDHAPNAGFNLSTPASIALGMRLVQPDALDGYERIFALHAQSPAATPYRDRVWAMLQNKRVVWKQEFVREDYLTSGAILLVEGD